MDTDRVDFTGVKWGGVEWTNLVTLYLRAMESRSPHSLLRDRAADEALARIDYDFERVRRISLPAANKFLVALRAKRLDRWAADFLARHPGAVVLHLGCGLDSRAFRIERPAGTDWIDLDLPEVIALRRRLYSEGEGYRMVGAPVTDPSWLAAAPSGRPGLVVAEGLLMYLAESEVRELLRRLVAHFPSGELLFDAMAPWIAGASRLYRWGMGDPHEVERWEPRLKLLAAVPLVSNHPDIPVRGLRAVYRLMNAVPVTRDMMRHCRYAF
ncbi:class I SAM-dependent methyltransferase [Allonocardiopsis opalescens]|uniref:O-methyltransferase involved in polyketide biosynthesis n=1 Tax=Allonocardiopsis opalescens TaxID=1144618 RepID=A0A2T0QET5_9ACTN|nr:class I SAM-dependent methyltransferase [Allonocardiopsis opalescens]PRY02400.1 O-methyltransferase involved in polyketide biosynthesis [Allonocardiopsis opalescens]